MGSRVELIWANQSMLDAGQRMQQHCHACHQLYYILEGTATFIIGGASYDVQPGSCFIIPAMVPHEMLCVKSDLMHSFELKLFIKDPFLLSRLQNTASIFRDDGVMKKLLTYVVENWNCRDSQNMVDIEYILSTVILSFFTDTLHYENKDSSHILTEHYSAVTKSILVYIENHFSHRFQLQTMAERLNYNKNYLCSVFHKNTGVSIVDYLNFVRIRRAVIFFAFYGQDVYTACESVGFSNLSHFSRTFKSLVGIPPRDFRKAFSMISPDDAAKYFADEGVLNYRLCSITEAFASLLRSGETAKQILQRK